MSNTERYTLELPTTYLNAQGRVCLLEAGTVVVKAGDYDSAQAEVTRLRGLLEPGELWSFFRLLLEQGGAIQQDYNAGRFPSYEHYSARLDQAARERVDKFLQPPQPQEPRHE